MYGWYGSRGRQIIKGEESEKEGKIGEKRRNIGKKREKEKRGKAQRLYRGENYAFAAALAASSASS
jgi:hypothetical protein